LGTGGWIHAVEVAFESVYVRGPEAAELREPGIDFTKRAGLEAVETALRVHRGFDEAGITQDTEVLGDGGLGHAELTLDFSYGLLGGGQEAQDGPAVRLRDDFEDGFHSSDIPCGVYTCQGI
jgi:hypothetical protein